MRKEKSDYKMVQMDKELHTLLKDYCKTNGFSMSGFVAASVKQRLKLLKKKQYEGMYYQSRKHPGWSN